jgi:peptidoglycan/LPS O-acetylase OafA/YrhL
MDDDAKLFRLFEKYLSQTNLPLLKLKEPISREATQTLKGISILGVVTSHFLSHYVNPYFAIYGSMFVTIFFVVSGIGIYYSLEKRFKAKISLKETLIFYFDRLVRLFPLLWLVLFIDGTFIHAYYYSTYDIMTYLGLKGPNTLWFIPHMIKCYLASILLYFAIKKLKPKRYITILSVGFLLINFIVPFAYAYYAFPSILTKVIPYYRAFLSTIFLFGAGMAIPSLINRKSRIPTILYFAVLLAITNFWDPKWDYFGYANSFFTPIIFIIISIFVFVFFSRRYENRIFSFFGRYSYSLFLFHMLYYKVQSLIFPAYAAIAIILLFPLFLLLMKLLEDLSDFIINKLRDAISGISRMQTK